MLGAVLKLCLLLALPLCIYCQPRGFVNLKNVLIRPSRVHGIAQSDTNSQSVKVSEESLVLNSQPKSSERGLSPFQPAVQPAVGLPPAQAVQPAVGSAFVQPAQPAVAPAGSAGVVPPAIATLFPTFAPFTFPPLAPAGALPGAPAGAPAVTSAPAFTLPTLDPVLFPPTTPFVPNGLFGYSLLPGQDFEGVGAKNPDGSVWYVYCRKNCRGRKRK